VGFSIDSKGYIGLGWDGLNELTDFWEYDPTADEWTQVASFEGIPRTGAIAFSLGAKGYVGAGNNGAQGLLADFWEYDPLTNGWTQKPSLNSGRTKAYALVIDSKAFVGGGLRKDFYQYDPVLDTWTRKQDCPHYSGMAAFTIGTRGFVQHNNLLWMYDPTANQWTSKASLPSSLTNSKGFSTGDAGYIGTGLNGAVRTKLFFKYTPD
jgi:N-acetylneuraminic acid mutarotase